MTLFDCFKKSKNNSDKWMPYFEVYERHVNKFIYSSAPMTLVEVGVQKGGSLEMWANYFGPSCQVIGVDVDPECAKLQYPDHKNIKVMIGDQGSAEFWDKFPHRSIDIFIDDGGHYMDQQILTFKKVFPLIKEGGVYICEDTHTSYQGHSGGGLNNPASFIEFAKGFVDVLHYDWKEDNSADLWNNSTLAQGISSTHFYDSVVVFEKFGKREMKRVFANE